MLIFIPDISFAGLAEAVGEGGAPLIPGIFMCISGDAAGVGEGAIFIPGMPVISGVGDGDDLGVGEGVAIEWFGCCAESDADPAKNSTSIRTRLADRGPQAGSLRRAHAIGSRDASEGPRKLSSHNFEGHLSRSQTLPVLTG